MAEGGLHVDVVGVPRGGRALARWLQTVAPRRARGSMTLALASDAAVRRLNKGFRGVDRATDVLSFPAGEPGLLGDVIIARGVARRQARSLGHPLTVEIKVLALHGLIHLLGYDHERDSGQMARLESRLRRRSGLPSGLIERAGAAPARVRQRS